MVPEQECVYHPISMNLRAYQLKFSKVNHLLVCTLTTIGIVAGSQADVYASSPKVVLEELKGEVSTRAPGNKKYVLAKQGTEYVTGTRLKTASGAWAKLKYSDGTIAEIKSDSEIVVKASKKPREKPNGVVLFFGRVWSKVTKSKNGDTAFEVRSANAVAGVRGTEFETGVASDGTVMVRVSEGRVAVSGEDPEKASDVDAGTSIQSDNQGGLGAVSKSDPKFDWNTFFVQHAKNMENRGLKVAKALDGRLNRRKAKLERLVKQQRQLRKQIEGLVAKRKRGASVDKELQQTTAKLERVTARLEDMKARLEGAFGLFESWGRAAKGGSIKDGAAISGMAKNIAKIAADFADMIEEGTDLSEEGMDELMDDMSKGKRSGPGSSAADELFK